jgi:hypothetical protein
MRPGERRQVPGAVRRGDDRLSHALVQSGSVAVLPFVVARAIVLVALLLARFLVTAMQAGAKARSAAHAGLLGWDAHWYAEITSGGYGGAGRASLRFFPLLPLVARAVSFLPGVDAGAAVLVVSNASAFVALAMIHRLALMEKDDEELARRAMWMLALFPAGAVLVMGYAESLLLVTTLAAFLALRRRRFGWAAAAGLLAGLCRPFGILLAVPALVELVRDQRSPATSPLWARVAAVLAPLAGMAAYLGWSAVHDGSFLLPLREQLARQNRGGFASPLTTLSHDAANLVDGTHLGTALHAPWAIVFVLLAVVLFVTWPAAYGAYAVATLAVALSAPNLTSLERYGLACFPFALALASLARRREIAWALLALSGALLASYGVLTFLGLYVP